MAAILLLLFLLLLLLLLFLHLLLLFRLPSLHRNDEQFNESEDPRDPQEQAKR